MTKEDKEWNDKLDNFAGIVLTGMWGDPATNGWSVGEIARQAYSTAAGMMCHREDHIRGAK